MFFQIFLRNSLEFLKNKPIILISLRNSGRLRAELTINSLFIMELKTLLHVCEHLEESKEVAKRLLDENLENKVSSYIKKYESKADAEGVVELKLEKNSRGLFDWKLIMNLDRDTFRYEREDYKNLDDLINHLFKHFKEEIASS